MRRKNCLERVEKLNSLAYFSLKINHPNSRGIEFPNVIESISYTNRPTVRPETFSGPGKPGKPCLAQKIVQLY